MVGSIRNATGALIQLLRSSSALNTNLVQNRIFPPGIVQNALMPRVTVSAATPQDILASIGVTAAAPTWKQYQFTIDVWDKDPKRCEQVAAIIEDVIGANRNYAPSTIMLNNQSAVAQSVAANGYFFILKLGGGSATMEVEKNQLYRRSMMVTGRWMQTG